MADSRQNQDHYSAESQKDSHNDAEDFALEAAIGDAFLQFGFPQNHKQDGGVESTHNHEEEVDLEAAVGNAFQSIQGHIGLHDEPDDENKESYHSNYSHTEYSTAVYGTTKHANHDYNNASEYSNNEHTNHETEDNPKENQSLYNIEENNVKEEDEEKPELDLAVIHAFNMAENRKDHATEDDQLQSAIGEAFKSLREFSEQPEDTEPAETDDDALKQAISASIEMIKEDTSVDEPVKDTIEHDTDDGLDLAAIVQNVVQQMAGTQDAPKPDIPHLDENVLAHFQLEANKDEEVVEDSSLQDAIATAVKSAILKSREEEEQDHDLEKLQMNQILQNAFSMALQSSKTDTVDKPDEKPVLEKPKSLSIAETLALHRSSMDAPKKDYSSIQSLETSEKAPMNPQLSSILTSLSQHIHSGNQTNLMLVIRQMTTALMLNKTPPSSSAAQDLLKEVKRNPEEQKALVTIFLETRNFLVERDSKAVGVIEQVLCFFDNHDIEVGLFPVSEYYDTAHEVLLSFDSARLRSILNKPEIDYVEMKEKVRTDNRERKKKWRELNGERNKDNDLRSRVLKRASGIFGEENSIEKKRWVEEEFSRRRDKRIRKEKKDREKECKKNSPDAKPPTIYADDQKLVKRVSDAFTLVAETGLDTDLQASLEATTAAAAVTASSYARLVGISDPGPVHSALTRILTNIVETSVRSGAFMRIPFLASVYQSYTRPAPDNKDLMDRLKTLTGMDNATGSQSALEVLQNSRKRLGLEFLTSDLKREKKEEILTDIRRNHEPENETPLPKVLTYTGLRMPAYKKPTPPKVVKQEILLPSPFISNKMTFTSTPSPSGLKKPGTFQRPTNKPNGRGMGFPTLHLPSFKH